PGDLFLSKLDAMVIELDDLRPDGTVPITEVTRRLAESLDIERVTKKFYTDFSTLRVDFIQQIEGISKESDRFWYASVLLNRLMFIYFLQKKGFIQNNTRYLETKFALYYPTPSVTRADGQFYREFLQALFFEGFAKPAQQRSPQTHDLLGEIKYLNGGLFIQHALETDYPDIHIPDEAFDKVWNLFGKYSWHLDDTPGATDNEINPDVLGYIFEKYINQKAFGAYYTRTEITQYLCERTLHAIILERIHENSLHHFEHFNEVLLKLDADMCRLLLKVLPTISILDPACGSGAFLVAAMKTLLDIYAAVYGKIDFLHDPTLTAELKAIRQKHPSIHYYARKRIITDNLYGVDIMQEATEIAKLRLFLALVSAARTVDELEPLPNIDFNIMAGNSLIGLLEVDATRFDEQSKTIDMLQGQKASEYRTILAEKNRLIKVYRHTSNLTDDLHALRDQIDAHKEQAYTALDDILLDEFNRLGIRYEQAQAKGKPIKRALTLADIQRLAPFHWGYEFDEIMARGGFDIIIANPPWEIFKPQAKEFFADYSDTITKNKMTIKDFEKEQAKLMKNQEIRDAWVKYRNRFPYVSQYFRSSSQYKNQIAVVNGKKAGSDINLYKLFLEQCFNLIRPGGECGIVIPGGIYSDLGAKQLREMLFTETEITGLFCFENNKEIFEGVHRSFKFVVLTFVKGGRTDTFPTAFMRHEVAELERFPKEGAIDISVDFIKRLSPDS
ncbi:MAG: Eco57I restriction-modification methylase domain-containing protein, partial [Phototrophicaceae bacterium]